MINIQHLVELRGVYDGWSIAVLQTGEYVNRWASDDDPTVPAPGYERRFAATEESIPADARRALRSTMRW